MGILKFEIIFDNPARIYAPGDTVTGRIVLALDSPKKCRGLKVKLIGEGKTRWNQGKNLYRGHEEYCSVKYYLVGGEYENMEIDSGEYDYSFACALPSLLPSSYESKLHNGRIRGSIRYTIKGIIDRPWKFDNETKEAFTVISKYDLNTDPVALEPVLIRETKTFGVFSQTPPLSIDLSLPVRGYVPGQVIPIKVTIENQSRIKINDIELRIEMNLVYLSTPSRSMKKKYNKSIVEFHKGVIEEDFFSFDHYLPVPSLPPSNLGNCTIIKINYAVELEAHVDRMFSFNLKISTPILIGTVPLLNYKSYLPSSYEPLTHQFLPSAPSLTTFAPPEPSSSAPPNYFSLDLPPPTYHESMISDKNLQEADDSDHEIGIKEKFAPRYPVYNFT